MNFALGRYCGNRWAAVGVGFFFALAGSNAMANTIVYDNFTAPGGYSLANYNAKWTNPFGLGEMAISDTRNFAGGTFNLSAVPFKTAYDFSVFDHIKYVGFSSASFAVPMGGSLSFSANINQQTFGTQPGRIINGTYVQSGLPYAQPTLVGQQAAAVLNMVDFKTGQLFDWFLSGDTAFTLIERLPSLVINPSLTPGDPGYVGLDKAYTQIINTVSIGAGPQNVAITYGDSGNVSYFLNGALVSHVDNVGVPLDKQGVPFSGTYPSYGPGESIAGKVGRFSIGTGLFSLLDAFPFQHPDRPDLAVSIPVANRAFGQGISASFGDVKVTAIPEPASWALMFAGFGLTGAALRRRSALAVVGA